MNQGDHLPGSHSLSAGDADPTSVVRGLAFGVAAGAVVAALIVTVGETGRTTQRSALLALLALPAVAFTFAAVELGSVLRLSGALDPTPGVVEAWGLAAVTAAVGTVAYGPVVGLGSMVVNASLVVLALFTYLLGPPWFGWRLLDGLAAADAAVVTLLLSVLSVVAGGVLLGVGAVGMAGGAPTLGGVGALGILAAAVWAASDGEGGDEGDADGDADGQTADDRTADGAEAADRARERADREAGPTGARR